MKKTELFDCEASFGISGYKRETTPITKEEMLSKFDRYGIDSALMRYEYASAGNARMGNLELCEVIKNDAMANTISVSAVFQFHLTVLPTNTTEATISPQKNDHTSTGCVSKR